MLPYLALLRMGFTLPSVLPRARCALTAPFHPCLIQPNFKSDDAKFGTAIGGLFSVALSVAFTLRFIAPGR